MKQVAVTVLQAEGEREKDLRCDGRKEKKNGRGGRKEKNVRKVFPARRRRREERRREGNFARADMRDVSSFLERMCSNK